MNRKYIDSEELLHDAYRLSMKIYQSGFRPDFIVGLWRGGSPVGIVVQDFFAFLGHESDHISVRTSYRGMESYQDMIDNADDIRVHGTRYLVNRMNASDSLLIVDDVFSTGLNVQAVINLLGERCRKNLPQDIRIAVPWYKPQQNRIGTVPDYYLNETDDWLVLPYELNGLSTDEISQHKPIIAEMMDL